MTKLFLLVFLLFCSEFTWTQAGYSTRIRCGESAGNKWINLVQVRTPFDCKYTIRPNSMFVCQLKVEFTTNLPQPLEPISPSGVPVCPFDGRIQIGKYTICGYNNKQHLHIKFDGSNLSNYETIIASATSGSYKMKVTQITCPLPPLPDPTTEQRQPPTVEATKAIDLPPGTSPLFDTTTPNSLLVDSTTIIPEKTNSATPPSDLQPAQPAEPQQAISSPTESTTQQTAVTEFPVVDFTGVESSQTDPPSTEPMSPNFITTTPIPAVEPEVNPTPAALATTVKRFPHLLLKRSARWQPMTTKRNFDMLRFDTYILAPEGCDQYFSSPKGFVESLNWNYGRGPYPHSMKYTVCFKAPPRTLELFLVVLDFQLGYNDDNNQVDAACNSTNPDFTTDYIEFPYPVNVQDTQLSATAFCGTVLQGRTLRVRNDGIASFTFNAGTNPGIGPVNRVFKFRYGYRYGGNR